MKRPVSADLQKQMDDLSKAFASLDQEMANLDFDPQDDASVEEAIDEMTRKIDAVVARFASSPSLDARSVEIKERFAHSIRAYVAIARRRRGGRPTIH